MDWRNAAAYAPLLRADRSILAWEWLRRDPVYREAADAGAVRNRPADWGLHAFEPPDRAAPNARPLWRAEVHPPVLPAVAGPPVGAADAFDFARLGPLATIGSDADGREHLLISDGLRAIRVDVEAGTLRRGPVRLLYLIAGIDSAERPLLTLRRFLALCRTGRFSPTLHPAEARAGRFILMLRAADALAEGATQREIAATLLSGDAAADRWRVSAPTVRARAQRLVRSARRLAGGGYRSLLA